MKGWGQASPDLLDERAMSPEERERLAPLKTQLLDLLGMPEYEGRPWFQSMRYEGNDVFKRYWGFYGQFGVAPYGGWEIETDDGFKAIHTAADRVKARRREGRPYPHERVDQ